MNPLLEGIRGQVGGPVFKHHGDEVVISRKADPTGKPLSEAQPHYLDYRTTHDVDAWWTDAATQPVRTEIIRVLETTLASYGQIKTRVWGDGVSVKSAVEGQVVFSSQIAARDAQLEPLVKLP